MSFLAPWALVIGAMGAAAMVVLHLVARQRPAAYVLPTTRFIPDQRTLVSRAATRPRDLLLLLLRVLLLLVASAAFARPVLAPPRGAIATVVLLDRSRAVSRPAEAVARARALTEGDAPFVIIAFDTVATPLSTVAWDSFAGAPASRAPGSLSAALIAARRASATLAERADSVRLIVVSPLAMSELDSATQRIRAQWPGAVRVERVALRADASTTWRLERALPAADPLGPALLVIPSERSESRDLHLTGDATTRLVRGPLTTQDSAFARAGGTVVRWDSAAAQRPVPSGLSSGEDVIVASLARSAVPSGGAKARWADGSAAATEVSLGAGCVRHVGIALPAASDLPLHAPFQRLVRGLLTPCSVVAGEQPADSSTVARLAGSGASAADAGALRIDDGRPSPLARWLLVVAMALALAELGVRAMPSREEA